MNDRLRGTIGMAAAMAISGTIGWLVVISGQPLVNVVFWRCAFGAAAMLVVCASFGLLRHRPPPRQIALAALGGIAVVSNWLLLFAAFPLASISIATAVYSTQPFMLVLLGALLLSEKLTASKLLWLGVAFAGLLLIVQARPSASYVGTNYLGGMALAGLGGLLYAIVVIIARKLPDMPAPQMTLIQTLTGSLLLAPLASWSALPGDAATWSILAALGIVHTALMFTLQYMAVRKLPSHVTGSLYFIYPVTTVIVDYFAFDHVLHPVQLAGIALILVAATGINLGWSLPGRTLRA